MLGKLAVAPHNRWKFAGPAKDGLGTLVLALQANVTAKGVRAQKRQSEPKSVHIYPLDRSFQSNFGQIHQKKKNVCSGWVVDSAFWTFTVHRVRVFEK